MGEAEQERSVFYQIGASLQQLVPGLMKSRPGLWSLLGGWHRSVLHRPQGAQGGLLRLGQSPDPRDIQSLVGAVASQRAQMLATLQVPDSDGPVIAATGQPASIGCRKPQILHDP